MVCTGALGDSPPLLSLPPLLETYTMHDPVKLPSLHAPVPGAGVKIVKPLQSTGSPELPTPAGAASPDAQLSAAASEGNDPASGAAFAPSGAAFAPSTPPSRARGCAGPPASGNGDPLFALLVSSEQASSEPRP